MVRWSVSAVLTGAPVNSSAAILQHVECVEIRLLLKLGANWLLNFHASADNASATTTGTALRVMAICQPPSAFVEAAQCAIQAPRG